MLVIERLRVDLRLTQTSTTFHFRKYGLRARNIVVSDLRLETGHQRFPVRAWPLAVRRRELSAVIVGLMSRCL